MQRVPKVLTGVLALTLAVGCVSAGKYDAAIADADRARAELETARSRANRVQEAQKAQIGELQQAVQRAESCCTHTGQALAVEQEAARACQKAVDEATAMNQGLRAELERMGRDVDQLLSAKGALASSLDQARKRLEELRRAQAAAEVRAALFKELALRFKRMIDSGDLQIVLRSGRMVLSLPNDVLFDSGKARIKPRGEEALKQVAGVLATIEGRRFQVAGHTDDDPIRLSGFASNWELAAERALQVVDFLIESGMPAEMLSAAGYSQFDPVASNDDPDGKARNRRIEITLQPNIDELIPVPQAP